MQISLAKKCSNGDISAILREKREFMQLSPRR